MAEISALRKHPCPECGGDAEWNAARQALVCPYCGTLVPWSEGETPLGATMVEHDLEEALTKLGVGEKGLKAKKRSVRCESCNAISLFDPERAAQRCEFCGSPAIVPTENPDDLITPESLLPVEVPATKVRDLLRQWYGQRWFAPNKLKRLALTDTLHGIYLPYWTFDAHADAKWSAMSGYYYYVTEMRTDAQGRSVPQQVRKVRWQPSSGARKHFFDDELVPATVGVHMALLRAVEPFPTRTQLKPYDPAYVRGWTVERYQIDLKQAAVNNHQHMERKMYEMCGRDVPGDTFRSLQVSTVYQGRTFKHILVPVWLVSYTFGRRSFQVVVNGVTGKIAGERPYSWVKITLLVVAVLLVLVLIFSLEQ